MNDLFEQVLNMSITGTYVILVVVLIRFILKFAPKKYSYILWSVVCFRLCCPFSFKSVVSILNINPIQKPSDIVTSNGAMNYINTPISMAAYRGTDTAAATGDTASPKSIITTSNGFDSFFDIIPYIWIGVVFVFIAYGLISYIKLRRSLVTATKSDGNIYQSDCISSPFILGIIKPKIYIPYGVDSEYIEYIIAHERYHLRRGDNIVKMLSFIVLCVHWFNPACWLAFALMSKDMEMSCDEKVLSDYVSVRKLYGNALLSFAAKSRFPSPSPLCFGESGIKARIMNVLRFRKPRLIVSVIAVVLCLVCVAGCAANPVVDDKGATIADGKVVSNKNSYTAGLCIMTNPYMSAVLFEGSDMYPEIVITDNAIEIKKGDGTSYKSTAVEEVRSASKENSILADGVFAMYDNFNELFDERSNITERRYYSDDSKASLDYVVLLENNRPYAFADRDRVFELLPDTRNLDAEISAAILNYNQDHTKDGVDYRVESHYKLLTALGDRQGENDSSCVTVYLVPYYADLVYQKGFLQECYSNSTPCAITFDYTDGREYTFKDYWQLREGNEEKDWYKYFPNNATSQVDYDSIYRIETPLRQNAFAKAIVNTDYKKSVKTLFNYALENIKLEESSYPLGFRELVNYGEYTMRYIYSEFLKGNQTGDKASLMMWIMQEMLGDDSQNISFGTPQEYFDYNLSYYQSKLNEWTDKEAYIETIRTESPYIILLLEMSDSVKTN